MLTASQQRQMPKGAPEAFKKATLGKPRKHTCRVFSPSANFDAGYYLELNLGFLKWSTVGTQSSV